MTRCCRLFFGLMLLFLVGCAKEPTRPAWHLGEAADYPRETHFVGVGIDKNRYGAEDRARAQIAKVFEVQVQAVEKSSESFWLDRLGGGDHSRYQQSASAELTTTTDRRLSGIRIAETWYDEEAKQYYVLAVLDRLHLSRRLKNRVDELDEQIRNAVERARDEDALIHRLTAYVRALEALNARAELAADLAVVSPSGFVMPAPYLAADVAGRIETVASQLSIAVDLDGDAQDIVRGAMVRALSKLNLSLKQSEGKDLLLQGTVQSGPYPGQPPWHWSHAVAQVEFFNGRGDHIDSVRKTVREGSRIESRADTLAREKLGEELAVVLVEELLSLGAAR